MSAELKETKLKIYSRVFGRLVKKSQAKYLLQGTNYTDVEETLAGVKRQHNIIESIDRCTAGRAKIEYPPEFREFLQKRLTK